MDPLLISLVSACTALVASKLDLLLNPGESDHQHLREAIEHAFRRLQSEQSAESETESDIHAITNLAQAILKREWLRVKLGT